MLCVYTVSQADDAQADITRYVKVGGTGDGTSWATASGTLQAMIDNTGTPCQIWVASGTYFPTVMHGGTSSRHLSFQMKNGVSIYGGFPNTGSPTWEQRDWESQKTILSGEIGNPGSSLDNCYHVFYHPGSISLDATALLDGFTITSAQSDGHDDWNGLGGGMFNWQCSPTIINCIFSENYAKVGGGMYNNSGASPTVINSIFSQNRGGMYNGSSCYPIIANCIFSQNKGGSIFGGIFNDQADSPIITNCVFWENVYAGIYDEYSYSTITNCIFTPPAEGDSIDGYGAEATYCMFDWEYFGTGNIYGNPMFVNPGSDNFHLQPTSPCIDSGSNPAIQSTGITTDFEGDDRIIDGNASGTATVDMGVDEYGVKVGVYVNLQGDERPFPSGWQVPINIGFYPANSGTLVMNGSSSAVFWFEGTTSGTVTESGTRAYFECPQSVAPGTYDITADTITTLMNVKRLVGIW